MAPFGCNSRGAGAKLLMDPRLQLADEFCGLSTSLGARMSGEFVEQSVENRHNEKAWEHVPYRMSGLFGKPIAAPSPFHRSPRVNSRSYAPVTIEYSPLSKRTLSPVHLPGLTSAALGIWPPSGNTLRVGITFTNEPRAAAEDGATRSARRLHSFVRLQTANNELSH